MAKVRGPLMSLAASGTYDKTLVFRTGGGGTTVAGRPKARSLPSPGQISHRDQVRLMIASWNALGETEQDEWKACTAIEGMQGFQLFWNQWFAQGADPENPPVNPCA